MEKVELRKISTFREAFQNYRFRYAWNRLVALLVIFAALEIPLRMIFLYEARGSLYLIDLFTSLIFALDAVVNYKIPFAYGQNGKKHREEKSFSERRTIFVFDILAALPIEFILAVFFAGKVGLLFASFRLIRLLKIRYLVRYLKYWQISHSLKFGMIRLVVFVFWFVLIAHWIACGFMFLDGIPNATSNFERYIKAFYWCITTLATVGYGDITPTTLPQTIYNIFVMIFGVCAYGYLIGNITGILANAEIAEKQFIDSSDRLNSFMKYHEVPSELQRRIHNYQRYMWNNHVGYNEEEIMMLLSPALRFEIALHIHKEQLQKVPLFKDASEDLLREIVLKIKAVVFSPGDYVFRAGDIGSEMYFINKGNVQIISKEHEILATLGTGQFFGEMALVTNQPRNASVRALEYCDLYLLDKQAFAHVIEQYPHFAAQIQKKVSGFIHENPK